MPENGRQNGADPESLRKLFIGGLSLETTEESMKAFYEQWGTVPDIVIMKDGITKKSRGFGFVTFDKAESVDEAMRNRPHEIDGKQVDPKRAVPREFSGNPEFNVQVKKLFIGGIKDDHTEEQVREVFGEFGEIEEVSLVDDKNTGKRRGFGFITFSDCDPVDKACLLKSHMVGSHQCNVKKALSKDEQQRVQMKRDRMGRDPRAGGMGGGRGGGMRGGGRGGRGGGDYGGGRGGGGGAGYSGAGGWGGQMGGGYGGGGGGGYGGAAGGYGYEEQQQYGGGYQAGYGGAAAGGYGAAAGGWGQGGGAQYNGGGQQIGGSWGQSW